MTEGQRLKHLELQSEPKKKLKLRSGISPLIAPSLLYALASAQEIDDLAFVDSSTYFYPTWRATDKKADCLGFLDSN